MIVQRSGVRIPRNAPLHCAIAGVNTVLAENFTEPLAFLARAWSSCHYCWQVGPGQPVSLCSVASVSIVRICMPHTGRLSAHALPRKDAALGVPYGEVRSSRGPSPCGPTGPDVLASTVSNFRMQHPSDMTSIADLASIVTSGATCVALVFAGLELQRSRAQDRRRHQVETEGVAVSWMPTRNPQGPIEGDHQGHARWVYQFTAYNPGQLPISDVRIEIHFALDITRLHYDGSTEELGRSLILTTPVLAGRQDRMWERTLLMKFAGAHEALEQTTATIAFDDPEGKHHHNNWPKRNRPPAAGLDET